MNFMVTYPTILLTILANRQFTEEIRTAFEPYFEDFDESMAEPEMTKAQKLYVELWERRAISKVHRFGSYDDV